MIWAAKGAQSEDKMHHGIQLWLEPINVAQSAHNYPNQALPRSAELLPYLPIAARLAYVSVKDLLSID